ncbi:MAG: FimB/Mfa2 family fimbrial subunit, partial [Odoribacteraceae bacterium]|nr:FimB/Mfa2 family fimbrial subunit [Odoribacteraceae bacterium]
MKTTIISLLTSFTVIIATLLSSCVQDLDGGKEQQVISDEMALVTLSLSAPSSPVTRAEATATENAISEVDVMLFDATSDKFIYRAHGTQIENQATVPTVDPDPYATKKFEARLPLGGPYKVVVLANARTAIAGLTPKLPIASLDEDENRSREAVLNSIVASMPAGKTNFPMWGYLPANVTISPTGNSNLPDIDLTRAVARVDVSLNDTITNFVLTSARLYNYHDKGHVAPEAVAGGYNLAPYPVAGSKQAEGTYISYTTSTSSFANDIYVFEGEESKPVTGSEWKANTCLVVGGLYDDRVNTPYPTYYRVEFYID